MEHIAAHQASQPGQHNTQSMLTHHPATNTQFVSKPDCQEEDIQGLQKAMHTVQIECGSKSKEVPEGRGTIGAGATACLPYPTRIHQ